MEKNEAAKVNGAKPEPVAQPKSYGQLIGGAKPPPHIGRHSRFEAGTRKRGRRRLGMFETLTKRVYHGNPNYKFSSKVSVEKQPCVPFL